MGEHANTRPIGFKDVADYIIIDGEIFFSPSIFLESKSPEIIDLFLDKFLNYLIELRVGETVAEQVFKALVIGWDDSFLFQEQLNGYFLELSNFSANGSICTKINLQLTLLDEEKKALILSLEVISNELPDRNIIS